MLRTRAMRRLAPVLFVLLAAGCRAPGHEYPPDVVENFMRACTARGTSEAACRCSLDGIRRLYAPDDYRALEARIARGEKPPQEILDLAADCGGR